MIELRPYETLGGAHHGWLDTRHHFSFADYYDPNRTGWGRLRVWNDDLIAPASGFAPHPHRDMEIITYVRTGAITHEDSLGNVGRTEAGDVQVMSAGRGIVHAERNLETAETAIFQIWIETAEPGAEPRWGARPFPKQDRAGRLVALASGYADDTEALPLRAPARVLGARLAAGDRLDYENGPGAFAYLVPATGRIGIGGLEARARDGVALRAAGPIVITAHTDSEFVLVETH